MTSANLTTLLRALGIVSLLLLGGTFLRAKVPFFRKILLPASVIGGFIGMLLGPNVLGAHAVMPEEYVNLWSLLPSVLIVPIFAAVPLGQGFNKPKKAKGAFVKNLPKVMMSCGLFAGTGELQKLLGFGFTLLLATAIPKWGLYRTFGYELWAGFCGGHGTAATVGAILQQANDANWATAQGVAVTFATIGILGGMIGGIARINIAARRGETRMMNLNGIPESISRGYEKDITKQGSVGREVTHNSSIEAISLHLAIILGDVAIAYILYNLLVKYNVTGLKSIPVWCYAMVLMYPINALLKALKLEWMIDEKLKARVSGLMSDFAICAAVASVPVRAVLDKMVPILILSVIGFAFTYFCTIVLSRVLFGKKDYPFERAIINWGTNTGVMITGMMLLKICDTEYSSPALTDFSGGYTMMALIGIFLSPIGMGLMASGTTMQLFLFAVACTVLYFAIAIVGHFLAKKADPESFAKD